MLNRKFYCIIALFFLSSCNNYSQFYGIPEASGICYMSNVDSFFIVGDEGYIAQKSAKGELLESIQYDQKYDFEAIVCNPVTNTLWVLNEKKSNILEVDVTNNFKIGRQYLLPEDVKNAEGFTSIGENKFIISTQTDTENLLVFTLDKGEFFLTKTIDFQYTDLSGLAFFEGLLYILSDTNNKIYIYNIDSEKLIDTIKVGKGEWEGITLTPSGEIVLVEDNG